MILVMACCLAVGFGIGMLAMALCVTSARAGERTYTDDD